MRLVLGVAGAGALIGGIAHWCIYFDDPRLETHVLPQMAFSMLAGTALCGIGWAIVGAIAGASVPRLVTAYVASFVVVATWVGIWGTYADVLAAATQIGWPLGGVIGVLLARNFECARLAWLQS